jgi:outer membrane protein assembly factor BamA
VEYAGGALGGGNYFVRTLLEGAYTRPITNKGIRTVGRVNLELGYIQPFGNDQNGLPRQLFFNDRFLLGGEQSIRGYNFRSVWVRDPTTGLTIRDINGFPQGGTRMGQFNLEYHYLVGGPFRIVFFADFGNVWGEGQDIELESLRKVAGAELRINVPLFGAPLRFIYSSNLDAFDNLPIGEQERFDSFDFSIGVSF